MCDRLGGRGKDAVKAKVHGLGGIVVGPRAIKDEHDPCTGNVAPAKESDLIIELGVVNFGESGGAEVEGALYGRHEFVFTIGFSELWTFRSCNTRKLRAEEVVGFGDMNSEMPEGALIGSRLEGEFVGRHGVSRGGHVLGKAREASPKCVGEGSG